jgi:hypothetical protein
MANIGVLDAGGASVFLKASGAGSNADPHIPEHVLGAGTNNIGDADVLSFVGDNADLDSDAGTDDHAVVAWGLPASGGHVIGGTGANPIRVDPVASTVQPVSIASMYVQAAVLASVIGQPTVTATVAGNPAVQGMAAHDAQAAGNPVQMGAVAQAATPLIAAAGDVVQLLADLTGALISRPALPGNMVSHSLKSLGAVTAQVHLNAAGSGILHNVTGWQVINPHGSAATDVCLFDGTTTLAVGYATASGGGFAFAFPTPVRTAANATLSVIGNVASVTFMSNIQAYKGF